jgi:tRNA(Ile)-lysidine synthase
MEVAAAPGLEAWVAAYVRREEMFRPGERVLAAVSGGPDSVALLHILQRLSPELGVQLGVAHFDHGLRGAESRDDAGFVGRLAEGLGLLCHWGQGDVRSLSRREKISMQMAARRLRLGFLKETCRGEGYAKLALGHTADDQVELFFLRLFRGAGAEGLKGMWPTTPEGLVRPLLAVGKGVLLAWLAQEGLPYRDDPSNRSRTYLRNRLRLDLLPDLARRYNPRLQEAVWRTQALLQEDERLLAPEISQAWGRVGRELTPGLFALEISGFLALPQALQKRLLRVTLGKLAGDQEVSSAQVESLLALARGSRSGGLISVGKGCVARAGRELHFFPQLPPPPQEMTTILPIDGQNRLGAGGQQPSAAYNPSPTLPSSKTYRGLGEEFEGRAGDLRSPGPPINFKVYSPEGWRWQGRTIPGSLEEPDPLPPRMARLDLERLTPPLRVRYFRPGDRFWPLGAPGPRKLQDFFVDSHIPRWLRPHLPLVTDAGAVIWVVGLRVAESVKARPASKTLLELEVSPGNAYTERIWEVLLAWRRQWAG